MDPQKIQQDLTTWISNALDYEIENIYRTLGCDENTPFDTILQQDPKDLVGYMGKVDEGSVEQKLLNFRIRNSHLDDYTTLREHPEVASILLDECDEQREFEEIKTTLERTANRINDLIELSKIANDEVLESKARNWQPKH